MLLRRVAKRSTANHTHEHIPIRDDWADHSRPLWHVKVLFLFRTRAGHFLHEQTRILFFDLLLDGKLQFLRIKIFFNHLKLDRIDLFKLAVESWLLNLMLVCEWVLFAESVDVRGADGALEGTASKGGERWPYDRQIARHAWRGAELHHLQ